LPGDLTLSSNYPNPFNAKTTISYDLPKAGSVTIGIYSILGSKVQSLVSEYQSAGTHSIIWDATNMPSGTYFYKIKTGEFTETYKMLLLK
jgi:flagellar hook assembly protein FlgD